MEWNGMKWNGMENTEWNGPDWTAAVRHLIALTLLWWCANKPDEPDRARSPRYPNAAASWP